MRVKHATGQDGRVDLLRVGLVGAGPWARQVHAPALAAHPGIAFAGVWTRRPTDLAAAHGVEAFATFEALLAEVDAVALAVPPAVQGPLAVAAAEAGRHLILDKPLADSLPAAERAAAAAAGVVSTTMFTFRFHPPVQEFLAGFAGPADAATTASARYLSGSALGGRYAGSAWRRERGALLDVGPHVVDLLDAALGEIVAVEWAHLGEPDLWRIGLRHVGGATSTLVLSRGIPIDPSVLEVTAYGSVGRHRLTSRPDDPTAGYGVLLDGFLADIATGRTDGPYSAARSLHVQRVLAEVERVV